MPSTELAALLTVFVSVAALLVGLFCIDTSTKPWPLVVGVAPFLAIAVVAASYIASFVGLLVLEEIFRALDTAWTIISIGWNIFVGSCFSAFFAGFEAWHRLVLAATSKLIPSNPHVAMWCAQLSVSFSITLVFYGLALAAGFVGQHAAAVAMAASCAFIGTHHRTFIGLPEEAQGLIVLVKFLEIVMAFVIASNHLDDIEPLIIFNMFLYLIELFCAAASCPDPPSTAPEPIDIPPAPVRSARAVRKRRSARAGAAAADE